MSFNQAALNCLPGIGFAGAEDFANGTELSSFNNTTFSDACGCTSDNPLTELSSGETSVGKTSLIKWLASSTGNHCVRINNHEHTDIQEYIGCYASSETGKLVFKEGVLIDAMRKGYWIILDELNLAPTDVLEALNRLLDDNRELFVTETQETVKAHPRFMLFATQNPPGLYGGRKVLSRAFRNRFVELHFSELPSAELETILHQRCSLPPSYCSKLVKVMLDLQSHRRGSTVFAGKHGFITLRDLFRWAERYRLTADIDGSYDWLQHLADDDLCDLPTQFKHVVWTNGMRRLAILESDENMKLFEWRDGPLVLAMKEDGFFLMDEISLADDSVLERLNSILEPERMLVLAEKGSGDTEDVELITASKKFRILATMNPGGDFGKDIAELMLDFIDWLTNQEFGHQSILTVRDILSWVHFLNLMVKGDTVKNFEALHHFYLDPITAFVHGACLVFIDGIGSGTTVSVADNVLAARKACLDFLHKKFTRLTNLNEERSKAFNIYDVTVKKDVVWGADYFGIDPFYIVTGSFETSELTDYALNAGTTSVNAQRLLRAIKMNRPVLLEGSPGVGKTSLVAALAKASKNHLVRINLSEQTLNLASQSVLEGLNACFDHRAEIYIPELGMTFKVQHERTKIFGCQNPYSQGGGRKGLPKSFLNRFTQVYVDQLSVEDMMVIGASVFPAIEKHIITKMVSFNNKLVHAVSKEKKWGYKGAPWEFNLRDIFRWCQLMQTDQSPGYYDPGQHVWLVYADRMRTTFDKEQIVSVFKEVFGEEFNIYIGSRQFHITPHQVQVGYSILSRKGPASVSSNTQLSLLHQTLQPLESVMKCIQMGWMVILVGPAASGKTSLVQLISLLSGHKLKVMAMNSAMDTTELLGGFEQIYSMEESRSEIYFNFAADLTKLIDDFKEFREQWTRAKDGQSRGTFEWIDGMLVQALQSGDWLLMDNVNFCRLFLAMDPTHGEISRAMRNRGVEIYVHGESEIFSVDSLDFRTLLQAQGITGDSICTCLLAIYTEIKETILAFYFQQVQEIVEKHLSSLKSSKTWEWKLLSPGLWPDPVPSALQSTEDSCLSTIIRDGQVLTYCLNMLSLSTNRVRLLMDRVKQVHIEEAVLYREKKKGNNSILRLCKAFQKGSLEFEDLPYPVLAHIAKFFAHWDCHMEQILQTGKSLILDENLSDLQCRVLWRDRLRDISDRIQADSHGLAVFALHWHWVQKHLISKIPTILIGGESQAYFSEIQCVVMNIENSLCNSDVSFSVATKLQNVLGKPLPFKVESVATVASQLKTFCSILDVLHLNPKREDSRWKYKLNLVKAAADGVLLKKKLLNIWCLVLQANYKMEYTDTDIEKLKEIIESQRSQMSTDGLLLPKNLENDIMTEPSWINQSSLTQLKMQTQMWPAMEFLTIISQYKLVADILEEMTYSRKSDISNYHLHLCQHINFCLQSTPTDPEQIQDLCFIQQNYAGPGIMNRAVWLKCFFELLTNCKTANCWSSNDAQILSSSLVSLGEWSLRTQQLLDISNVLWTNIGVSSFANFRETDQRLQGILLHRHLKAIQILVPDELKEEYLEYCRRLITKRDASAVQYMQQIFRSVIPSKVLPESFICETLTCIKLFARLDAISSQNVQSGIFWVHMGLLQMLIWMPQTLFDPALKRMYKLGYLQKEAVVNEWDELELLARQREKEKTSLYRYRSQQHGTGLSCEHNEQLIGSQLLISALIQNTILNNTSTDLFLKPSGPYDFYQHANIAQVRLCHPVLEDLNKAVQSRLQEWPEHPALMQVLVVIERILAFPISDPLAKFLNGLEILLAKAQDWEENASRSVSFRKQLDAVTQLIIQWRKLELNCWTESLDNTLKKHSENSAKHWFPIYQLLESHLQQQRNQENFEALSSLLWNLYNYYKQFSYSIQAKVTELRHPIEKELKFVKRFGAALNTPCRQELTEQGIERSLDCVDRTQQDSPVLRLNKVLKRILLSASKTQQSVTHEETPELEQNSLQSRLVALNPKMRKMCMKLMKKSALPQLAEDLDLFTAEIIKSVQELQNLTVDNKADKEKQRCEAKNILQQKQRALSELFKLLSQTGLSYRKGITWSRTVDPNDIMYINPLDLKGALNVVKSNTEPEKMIFAEIPAVWDGCQKYFYRSIARHACLREAFLKPSKELGLGNVERCKGFTAHLLKLLVDQRKRLSLLTEEWVSLRKLVSAIQDVQSQLYMTTHDDFTLPPQSSLLSWIHKIHNLSSQCLLGLQELSLFLQCCPDPTKTEDRNISQNCNILTSDPATESKFDCQYPTPFSLESLALGCRMRKGDSAWLQLTAQVSERLKDLQTLKADLDKIFLRPTSAVLQTWHHFDVCSSGLNKLGSLASHLQDMELFFSVSFSGKEDCPYNNPGIIQTLRFLRKEIEQHITEFTTWRTDQLSLKSQKQESSPEFALQFFGQIEGAISAVLCTVQSLVKRKEDHKTKSKEVKCQKSECKENEDEGDLIRVGHLTKLLDKDLSAEVSSLNLEKIPVILLNLLESVKIYREDCAAHCLTLEEACLSLVRLLPMLSTYVDLVQFFLIVSLLAHRSTGKLLSVLASIFTEIAQKGFCLPEELVEEASGEGATEFHDYEGGGIGEGEGTKDVSDKIENEEQVEDTFQQGQEKKDEEQDRKPDIKEEENAVEMSEDFDGQIHDGERKEPGEDEEEQSDDEEEDLDKKMGNLGEAEADQLDERLWGDDDNEEEDTDDEEDESGQGMDEGESQLVAKEDNLDAGNTNKDDKHKEEELTENKEEKDKINEQPDKREFDENEVDPYHGKQEQQPVTEPMDLPDDLNLDNDEEDTGENQEGDEENPMDIEAEAADLDNKQEKDESLQEEQPEESEDRDGQNEQAVSEDGEQEMEQENESKEDHDKEADGQENDSEENMEINEEEKENKNDTSKDDDDDNNTTKDEENSVSKDLGHQSKEEEVLNEDENDLPESENRREHESDGQTGEENLQSDTAVELAGAASEKDKVKESFKRKPGQADNERSTGDVNERVHKKLRTLDTKSEKKDKTAQSERMKQESDVYEHIKELCEPYDAQTYDVASAEQQDPAKAAFETDEGTDDISMEPEEQEDDLQAVDAQELKPEQNKHLSSKKDGLETTEMDQKPLEREEDNVEKQESEYASTDEKTARTTESLIFTVMEHLMDTGEEATAADMWRQYQSLTSSLSQQLCEQLRLILEPTQAAKLKGDFRTGKRLNMRKVIPYIASQFRKDKIWLRRTKPSKREYQICLAIDDSSSMIDNHSKQMAFESLSVIGNALTLLEVGRISVCSFGESFQLLHPFHEQFNEQSGSRILRLCKFQQKKTKIAEFLDSAAGMFIAARQQFQTNIETAQLLLIVSDGRGLFLEGKERVTAAVQGIRSARVFVIFVVLDNPNSRDSVLDIKVPIFKGPGEMPEIKSYMEEFPFPFYIILRDVNALPETLSDALRQWFELVTAADQ
ncbi:MDN1 protein, partial [Polypterus senegalus]